MEGSFCFCGRNLGKGRIHQHIQPSPHEIPPRKERKEAQATALQQVAIRLPRRSGDRSGAFAARLGPDSSLRASSSPPSARWRGPRRRTCLGVRDSEIPHCTPRHLLHRPCSLPHPNPKYFLFYPSHQIFQRRHGALNVGKKSN
jgi:hypothetical protein